MAIDSCNKKENKKPRHQRMDKLDVVQYIRAQKITSPLELIAAAESRREAGDPEFARFILKMNQKARAELLDDAWQMHHALDKIKKSKIDRISHIKSLAEGNCNVQGCKGLWFKCALDVLLKNDINKYVYADTLYNLIEKGRGKHRNILLVAERDCAKSFLVDPIATVFPETFSNPASSAFSWIGVDTAQAILLNDFRWKPMSHKGGIIEWDAFLRLLEGAEVNLPAPMNSHAKHIKLTTDILIIATSSHNIRFYFNTPEEIQTRRHKIENEGMEVRWKIFHLTYQFSEKEKITDIPKCPHFFL